MKTRLHSSGTRLHSRGTGGPGRIHSTLSQWDVKCIRSAPTPYLRDESGPRKKNLEIHVHIQMHSYVMQNI